MNRFTQFLSHDMTPIFTAALAVGVFVTFSIVSAKSPSAQSRTHIETCDEAGLCKKGEQKLLFDKTKTFSSLALQYAFAKGCHVSKELKQQVSLDCPAGFTVPYAHTERVFHLHDALADAQIGATAEQQSGITGKGVLVAVLDTGVDVTHPELSGKIQTTANFTTDPAADAVGHGTHVSGIIAGQGVNDVQNDRALGVAPDATLIVGKVCNDQGSCLESDIDAGIEWAVSQHARVINMSFGGGSFLGNCDDDPLAAEANWAASQGVSVVAAAGNSGGNGEGISTPACGSKVISVGAVDATDTHPSWSSFGTALDIVAPGVSILSSLPCSVTASCPTPGYGFWSGTSMATPNVTGLVALLLQVQPTLTPAQVMSFIEQSAKDIGTAGFDSLYGYGRIDAAAAVLLVQQSQSSSSSVAQSSVSSIASSASSMSTISNSSSADSSMASRNEKEDDGESSSHAPRACTANDWFCNDFEPCDITGHQTRHCLLQNSHCNNADAVKPIESRSCGAPRGSLSSGQGSGDQGGSQTGGTSNDGGDSHAGGNGGGHGRH